MEHKTNTQPNTEHLTPLALEQAIIKLKEEKNAVILGHYYQDDDIQDIADFIGDSLDLSRKAQRSDADIIVFCGVKFMAEVAKTVNPKAKVLLPDMEAGCSLETSCPPNEFAKFKYAHPDHLVITYINCSAEIKALSDIIVTSTNAEHIISQIPQDQPIIFAPDKNLGAYLNRKTSRNMLLWNGACIVHERFSREKIHKLKVRHDDAILIAHPECQEDVLGLADFIGSTTALIKYAQNSDHKTFIVATEPGILHHMQKTTANSGKTFIEAPANNGECACNVCPYMKLNTMEKLYYCLRDEGPEIMMDHQLITQAALPIEKMLSMSATPVKL